VLVTRPRTVLDDLDQDPYPVYDRLRAHDPVYRIPELNQWLVTRWPDVHAVLADGDRFSSDIPGAPLSRFCAGPPLLHREGPDHRTVRAAFEHDYDPHRVADHVDAVVRPHAQRRAEQLRPAGSAELIGEFFQPVMMRSHAELIGLGGIGVERLRRWGAGLIDGLTNTGADPARAALIAMADMEEALRAALVRVRAEPDDSVLAHLAAGRPDRDVLPVVKQFAQGQFQSAWLAGWTLLALWDHPDQLAEIRTSRWLLGAAVYEALRWSPPVGAVTRRTTGPVTLHGVDLPAGSVLAVSVASANRDESVFPAAGRFDPHRTVRTNLGFGAGRHHCPAFAFVAATARTCLDVYLDQFPNARPAPDWQARPHGWKLRQPGPITVDWTDRRM
jgi:cytochrome P450